MQKPKGNSWLEVILRGSGIEGSRGTDMRLSAWPFCVFRTELPANVIRRKERLAGPHCRGLSCGSEDSTKIPRMNHWGRCWDFWQVSATKCGRTDTFEVWCWRRHLRVPWTKQINLEYSSKGLMLKLSSSTLATWWEKMTHWKRPWCWERVKTGGEGSDRQWDGWMASLTQWTWVWANSRREWKTGKHGMLQAMGSQTVVH